jgi:hypothetical protein
MPQPGAACRPCGPPCSRGETRMHLCPITESRSMTGLGAVRFHGARRRRHDWVALGPRHGQRQGSHGVYLARPARHDSALAGRAGGDDAHLHPESQPALPTPGSNASSNTGKRNRGERCLTRHKRRIRPGRRRAGHTRATDQGLSRLRTVTHGHSARQARKNVGTGRPVSASPIFQAGARVLLAAR